MITKEKKGRTSADAARLATYLISPKPGHEDYRKGERLLLLEVENALPPLLNSDMEYPEEGVWAEQFSEHLEDETRKARRGKPMPKEMFVHAIISFDPSDFAGLSQAEATIKASAIVDEQIKEVMPGRRVSMKVIHGDTDHLHAHLMVSTVDLDTGKIWNPHHSYRKWELANEQSEVKYGLKRVMQREAVRQLGDEGRAVNVKAPTTGERQHEKRTGIQSAKVQLQEIIQGAAVDKPAFRTLADRLKKTGVTVIPQVNAKGLSGLSYRLHGEMMKGSDLGKGFTGSGIQKVMGVTFGDEDRPVAERLIQEENKRRGGIDKTEPPPTFANFNIKNTGKTIEIDLPPLPQPDIRKKLEQFENFHLALGAMAYRVSLVDRAEDGTRSHKAKGAEGEALSASEVRGLIESGSLGGKNKAGFDIYITPMHPDFHYLLLDDLKGKEAVMAVIQKGFRPALVQTTSEGNYQGILKVKKTPDPDDAESANALVNALNQHFDGDKKIHSAEQPFRLPGFANKKPNRADEWTLIDKGLSGFQPCNRGAELLEKGLSVVKTNRAKAAEAVKDAAPKVAPKATMESDTALYFRVWNEIRLEVAKKKQTQDLSAMDFQTARRMIEEYRIPKNRVASAMLTMSPDIAGRHGDDIQGYANRTVDAAAKAAGGFEQVDALPRMKVQDGVAVRRTRGPDDGLKPAVDVTPTTKGSWPGYGR